MTTAEAAEYRRLTISQISYICKKGKFTGARKKGARWLIPKQSVIDYNPGPRGFAKTQAEKKAKEEARLVEQNAAIRKAKGLPPVGAPIDNDADHLSGCLITVEQAAEIIGMSRRYIRQICSNGQIKGANKRESDGAWLIPYDELKKLPRWRKRRAGAEVLPADDIALTAVDGSLGSRD